MDQNIDFSGSDQIQTPQYPKIHHPSQEIRDKVFQVKRDLMESIQTFLEEFNYIPFEEKPQILLQAWYKVFTIQYAQFEDSNELFQKLLEDLQIIKKELIECNLPTFSENNEEHSVQHKENLENSSSSIQETEGPPQDFDIQLLCMHDNVDDLIESAFNSKLLSINSQRLNKEKQEVKNVVEQPAERRTLHAVAPILSTKEPGYSPSMGYEHPNTTPKMKSDEIIKSSVEELVPILSENEVTSEDKRECDVPVCKNSPIYDDHSEIFFDSKNVMIFQLTTMLLKTSNVFQIQDVVLREKLLRINRLIANIESLNDNLTPDRVLNSSFSIPIYEESNNSLSDNFSPEFETFCNHTKETRSGSTTTHADDSLPEYDSFCFEIEPDQERLINVVKNNIFDDSLNDPLLEEADLFLASDNSIPPESEDTIFDLGISVESRWIYPLLIEVSCVRFYCLGP
nr:hypothetical protein [Tanacetum cinerariifolium]GEZ09987.1 hypothetical protein [Tanacetum cinerariifolium]